MADPIIKDYPEVKYRGFLHNLFNIIEDAVQENIISRYIKIKFPEIENPSTYFRFLKEQMFEPQAKEYEDNGDISSFLNYLLLSLRVGRANVKGTNTVYDKYESEMKPYLVKCLTELNGTQRLYNIVELGEWIIKNIEEFDWEMPEPDPKEIVSGKMGGTEGVPTPVDGIPSDDISDDELVKRLDSEKDTDYSEKEDADLEASEPESLDDLDDDVFSDIFGDGNDHEWVDAEEAFIPNSLEIDEVVDQTLDECAELSKDISEFLNLFKGRKRPREMEGFTRGKLNIRRAMKDDLRNGCDTKLFNQKVPRGKQADVCVEYVLDNSGSMGGTKAELAFRGALAGAQACDWSGVPFEVTAFTKTEDTYSGTSVTINIKKFGDSFEKRKKFFGVTSSHLVSKFENIGHVPVFRGNSEEINLYYIGNKLAKVNHDKKIMFVFCDGCTTGSRDTLRKVVKDMENKGIVVIGIGLCDSGVSEIYSLYKVFNNTKELEKLGPYLIDTISRYVTA